MLWAFYVLEQWKFQQATGAIGRALTRHSLSARIINVFRGLFRAFRCDIQPVLRVTLSHSHQYSAQRHGLRHGSSTTGRLVPAAVTAVTANANARASVGHSDSWCFSVSEQTRQLKGSEKGYSRSTYGSSTDCTEGCQRQTSQWSPQIPPVHEVTPCPSVDIRS